MELTGEESKRILRRIGKVDILFLTFWPHTVRIFLSCLTMDYLELEAYSALVTALRAQGELDR